MMSDWNPPCIPGRFMGPTMMPYRDPEGPELECLWGTWTLPDGREVFGYVLGDPENHEFLLPEK